MKKVIFLVLVCTGLSSAAQKTGNECSFTIYLKSESGLIVAKQNFKLLDASDKVLYDVSTDDEGKVEMKLQKNTTYYFESVISGRVIKAEIPVGNEDNAILEIQLTAMNPPSEKVKVTLHVTDEKGITETEAKLTIKDGETQVFKCVSDIEGICRVDLDRGKHYSLIVEKFGRTFNLALDIPDDPELAYYTYDLKIKVIERYIRSFILEKVYFDYDKWDIKPGSVPTLLDLLDMLQTNPSLTIEVGGHTDSDGPDQYNMTLSQRRADAVKNWLITRGISETRLISKGYGEVIPVATNETEEGKAQNRRTEVKVITE